MTRLIAESKFTESNSISRELKLYSKAGPDIESPDACEKGKHTFEYSLYPHFDSWRKAFTYRRGWELNNPLTQSFMSLLIPTPDSNLKRRVIYGTEAVTEIEETNLLGDIIRPLNISNHIDFTCNPTRWKSKHSEPI